MKSGQIRIYQTDKINPHYKQFNGQEVMLIEEHFGDGGMDTYRWLVRHVKSGIKFHASVNELKKKKNEK